MGSELVQRPAMTMAERIQWANGLANADMLPGAYRGRPANLIWAAQYAESLGLHPMTAITGIYVIDGKPSSSAAIMSALVRRAGHKLRVTSKVNRATAQIIRHDDPDYVFEVTWEIGKNSRDNPNAEQAGLLGKDNWKKYPASMLAARAISQVAREACEEALMGVHYTPEELGAKVNADGIPVHVEQMDQIKFEDMLSDQIEAATSMDTLAKLNNDAVLGGVHTTKPTGSDYTILQLLNQRGKEILAGHQETDGAEGPGQDNEAGGPAVAAAAAEVVDVSEEEYNGVGGYPDGA